MRLQRLPSHVNRAPWSPPAAPLLPLKESPRTRLQRSAPASHPCCSLSVASAPAAAGASPPQPRLPAPPSAALSSTPAECYSPPRCKASLLPSKAAAQPPTRRLPECSGLRLTGASHVLNPIAPDFLTVAHSATSPWGRLERGEISLKQFEVIPLPPLPIALRHRCSRCAQAECAAAHGAEAASVIMLSLASAAPAPAVVAAAASLKASGFATGASSLPQCSRLTRILSPPHVTAICRSDSHQQLARLLRLLPHPPPLRRRHRVSAQPARSPTPPLFPLTPLLHVLQNRSPQT